MPPQSPQSGGDVLDQALHVARTQTTSDAKNAKDFFHAVAGTRSPLNRQSSRVADPFAVYPSLTGGTKPSRVPVDQQAQLAISNAKDKNVKGKPKRQAIRMAQTYVKADDTRKVVQKTTDVGRGHTGVQGAALTAPNIAAVGQRALGAVGAHIPLGSAAPIALRGIQALGLPNVDRQQVIGGIAKDATLDQPNVRAELAGAIKANGNTLPANANTRQLLQAALLPTQHHGSYWDAVNPVNILKDLIYTPLYTAQGGAALGHASRQALPTWLGGKGDTTELKAIGMQQLNTAEHPGALIQQHPGQAILAGIGALKTVGGLAGRAAALPETTRDVTLSNYPLTPISRGTLDQNLTTRLAQKTSDALLAKGPRQFQDNAFKNRTVAKNSQIVRERALDDRKVYSAYRDAGKGIKPREKDSLLQNASQGLTPAEREAFYKSLGETPSRSAQANLAGAQGERFGNGPLTPKQQTFVDAARVVSQHRTQTLKDAGDLSDAAALRNDYQPLIHVRASQGDATATNILSVEHDLRGWMEQETPKDPAARAVRDERIRALNEEHDQLVQQFASEHLAGSKAVASTEVHPGEGINYGATKRAGAFVLKDGRQLGPDDWVTLYHATSRENATRALSQGFKLGSKESKKAEPITDPTLARMLGKNVGDVSDYEIGRGQGSGTYLAPDPGRLGHFGDSILAVRVRVGDLRVPPERARAPLLQGADGPVRSTLLDDGYVEGNIPAENISLVQSPHQITTGSGSPGAEPFRVGKDKPKVKSQFAYPGKTVRANANLPISGIGKPRNFGDLLESGNFTQNHRTFERQLFEPNTRADARRFVEAVGNPDSGLGAVKAENGRMLTDVEKENYVLLNRDNLRTKPKNADRTIDASAATNKEAEIVRTAKDLNQAWEEPGLDRVPNDGDFVLVPKPVKAQVDQQVARVRPGSLEHRVAQGTRAFKTGVLMTRPTYPATNLANGILQGGVVGTGLASWTRAIRGSLPTLPGVEDAGFVAREFGHATSQTARGYLEEGRPIRALGQATIGNYVKGIRNASVGVDNLARKATANKLAVGEAKKLAGWNKFHRTFGRVNDDIVDLIQKMADGDTPETRAAAERVLQGVNDVQGDYGAMRSHPLLDATVPFHRWTRFIGKLMLKTLPLKYPGRTLGAYQLGNLGEQAAGQKGELPQWLADLVDVRGTPTARLQADFSRTNPFTSLGTTFEPDANGNPDRGGILSQLSPYASIGYGAFKGKNLETGNPLLNGQGKPATGYGDMVRFLGAQVAGFVPPLGALAGGQAGKADTSIPFPGLTQNLPPKMDGTPRGNSLEGPTVDILGHWIPALPIANQILPFRLTERNQEADQLKGFKAAVKQYRKEAQAQWAALASQPGKAAEVQARYERTMAAADKNAIYYEKNPKALAALLAAGTGGG